MDQTDSRGDRFRDGVYKLRYEPGAIRRFVARKLFGTFEFLGFHVTADHFYEAIPNTKELAKTYVSSRRPCKGIDFHESEATALFKRIVSSFGNQLLSSAERFGYYEDNAYFRGVDGLTLYCMIRELRPAKVIEIGQGFSTRVTMAALEDNASEGEPPQFISVDPYARFTPKPVKVKFESSPMKLQDAAKVVREGVGAGDLLFVDSSHVFKAGSDVQIFFDEIYPYLPAGVHVHVHDIFSPFDYPLYWMTKQRRFWNEQYYLENFLRFNDHWECILPLHLLMRESEECRTAAASIVKGGNHLFLGQSIYFRTK